MLSNVFLWVIPLLIRDINVIILILENVWSQWMLPFLSHNHIFHPSKLLTRGKSPNEEKSSMSSALPVLDPMPEHDKQNPIDESPTDAACEPPPVTELRVNSRRQKSKATPNATFRTSDPDSGNDTPTCNLNSIPDVNDMNMSIPQRKRVRSYTQHPIFNFASYQHLSPSYALSLNV
jgi:hypothetical protein